MCMKILLIYYLGCLYYSSVYICAADDKIEVTKQNENYAKSYFEDVREESPKLTSFISTTIHVNHYDLIMNAYRSMTTERQVYFLNQIKFEDTTFVDIAKNSTTKLITDKIAFISVQAEKNAVNNFYKILKANDINYKKFDLTEKLGYNVAANKFVNKYAQSSQEIEKENCTIGFISVVGIRAKWKYPFTIIENQFMKAEGQFNFAHDMKLNVDILQIPFKDDQMILTMVIPRKKRFYIQVQALFHLASAGKFHVKVGTLNIPKLAFSVIIKDYSVNMEENIPSYNMYRCMAQKMVLNFEEDGVTPTIKQPIEPGPEMIDWKYEDEEYYPPKDNITVDSPFFFIIRFEPTKDVIFLGKWVPAKGMYIEETLTISEDYY